MRSKALVFALSLLLTASLRASDPFKITGVSLGPGVPVVLYVGYDGSLPALASSYILASDWKAEWQTDKKSAPTIVSVDQVTVDAGTQTLALHLSGTLPKVSDMRAVVWSVLLSSDQIPFTIANSTPISKPVPPAGHRESAKKSCTDDRDKPFLCPPGPKDTPDLSMTGSFTAAGGTKPLYQFELKGGVILPRLGHFPFDPAINTQVEINQNPKPPIQRTRFDPDSITAGLAFTNYVNFNRDSPMSKALSGMRFQAELPEGEFSRADPSSNIIAEGVATFDFKPILPPRSSAYFTLYPFVGMEVGRNLNHPNAVEKIPVDLSHYNGIVRGFAGADARFAVQSKDRKSSDFSINGTYRVRLPAVDEPFLETMHEVTTFAMTTKARHWVESDVSYTVPNWKFFCLTATYQYGVLPPFYELVDHKVTIGFKLQAVQPGKPLGTKLVQ